MKCVLFKYIAYTGQIHKVIRIGRGRYTKNVQIKLNVRTVALNIKRN